MTDNLRESELGIPVKMIQRYAFLGSAIIPGKLVEM